MSVPDGELILMVELGLALVLNNGAIELGVVGPGESNNENLNKVRKTPSLDIVILIQHTELSCTLTLNLACSLLTMGSWILMSQPSALPSRHS